MANDSRERMVRSAASLIGSHGVSATSFSDVLADSGAPRGSIYHHFPDGKRQLAEDAIRWTSERVLAYQSAGTATTPAEVLDRFIGMWRRVVETSSGSSGCVVAGVALDTSAADAPAETTPVAAGSESAGLLDVVRETFRSWIAVLASQLAAVGVPDRRAASIATATVAGMEGALILCRAEGNSGPLNVVAAELHRLLL